MEQAFDMGNSSPYGTHEAGGFTSDEEFEIV